MIQVMALLLHPFGCFSITQSNRSHFKGVGKDVKCSLEVPRIATTV